MKTLTGLSVFQIPFTVCAFSSTESNFSDIEDLSNILRCVCVSGCIYGHLWWQFLQTDLLLGLKKMLYSFVQSMKRLSCVLVLTAFMLCIFATINLQLFMGSLRQKCILMPVLHYNLTVFDNQSSDFNFYEHINNPSTTLWKFVSVDDCKVCVFYVQLPVCLSQITFIFLVERRMLWCVEMPLMPGWWPLLP